MRTRVEFEFKAFAGRAADVSNKELRRDGRIRNVELQAAPIDVEQGSIGGQPAPDPRRLDAGFDVPGLLFSISLVARRRLGIKAAGLVSTTDRSINHMVSRKPV